MRRRRDEEVIADLTVAIENNDALVVLQPLTHTLVNHPRTLIHLSETNKTFNRLLREFPEIWRMMAASVFKAIFRPIYATHFGFFGVQLERLREQTILLIAEAGLADYKEEIFMREAVQMRHTKALQFLLRNRLRVVRLGGIVPIWSELEARLRLMQGFWWFGITGLIGDPPLFARHYFTDSPMASPLLHVLSDCVLIDDGIDEERIDPTNTKQELASVILALLTRALNRWRDSFDQVQVLGPAEVQGPRGPEPVERAEMKAFVAARKLIDALTAMIESFDPETMEVFPLGVQDDEPWREILFSRSFATTERQRDFIIGLVDEAHNKGKKLNLDCSVCGAPGQFANQATGLVFCASEKCQAHQ
jgi:hypothetical protein